MVVDFMRRWGVTLVFSALLFGCVTTIEGPFTKNIAPDKAVNDYVALGYAYLEAGDVIKAKQRIERALELNSKSPEAHTVMAMIWRHEGEMTLAEDHFKKALHSDDSVPKTYHLYGQFLMEQKRYPEAAEQLEKVSLELEYENRAEAMLDLGHVYLKLEKIELAFESFKKAQRLGPSLADAHLQASALALDRGDQDYTVSSFQNFRELVARGLGKHNAQSVYLGIRLARLIGDRKAETAYVKVMYRNFRDSPEFQAFINAYKPFLN